MTPANKANKQHFLWVSIIAVILAVSGGLLNLKIEALKKANLKNKDMLSLVLCGFNNQSLEQLKAEIKNLKTEIVNLAGIFDPKEKWLKKDYDLSIHFVEELGKVNQALKTKAAQKKVDFQELGFKEKLPSESEAFYLLSQLYGLKEVINLGLDYSVNFKRVEPLGIEESAGLAGIKLAKSRIGLVCPGQGLLEFIIQLNEIVPRPYTESFALKFQGSSFEMDLLADNIVIDLDWKDKEGFSASPDFQENILSALDQGFIRTLRSTNPCLVVAAENASSGQAQSGTKEDKPKQLQRFFYKGKAKLKSKEVVVVEDAMRQETVFLGLGEKIDNFALKKISNEEIVLKNIDDGKEIIVKRQE